MTKNVLLKNKIFFLLKFCVTFEFFRRGKTVYNDFSMCYNCFVKKGIFFTTSLCSLLCAAFGFQNAAAFADTQNEGFDSYPESFTKTVKFDNLKDYAIGENKYYFLENNAVSVYEDDSYSAIEVKEKSIDSLHYDNGFFYGAEGKIFDFEDREAENFTCSQTGEFYINGYLYYSEGDKLCIFNRNTSELQQLEGFSNLKNFGNTAYAVKENALYKFDGVNPLECILEYSDYSPVKSINTGDTADKLKNTEGKAPVFVRINQGAFMTEITDINALSGKYFETGATIKTDAKTVLLLCTCGTDDGISIVMIAETANGKTKGNCYMLRTADTRAVNRESVEKLEENSATVTIAEGFIYSSPYVCASTQAAGIKSGDKVEIAGVVRQNSNPEIMRDFYLVKLSGGASGYVPHEYVSMFEYIEKEPEKTVDPDYSEEDMIKPVVLIIIVIALVLIAVGYLVYVGTSDKKKLKKDNGDKNSN